MSTKIFKHGLAVSIITLIMLFMSQLVSAQVITRVLTEKEALKDFLPFPTEESPEAYRQPTIDFERVLEEDRANGRTLQRFSVRTDVDYALENGTWTNYEAFSIWRIVFDAPDASSLSFGLRDIKLPESAEMYIYSIDDKIIQGPITSKNLFENTFTSDVIESDKVEIAVIVHVEEQNLVTFNINSIGQGIKLKKASARAWTDANDCNIDVNCPVGVPWTVERDAVALILSGQTDWCSGSLINNQCQDLTPNFLTAFHCVTGVSPAGFVFRFKFEAGTPTCPGNSTGNQGTWITFSGSTLLASSATTASDFALLLMGGTIAGVPNLAMAGWNRNVTVPQQVVTAIHHPEGDAKKISIDDEVLGTANTSLWRVDQWDIGLVQHGSSGCPLFDANHRIIGQLHGGVNMIGCNPNGTSLVDNNDFGRLSVSWTSGLSGFLAGANAPMTTNSIRVPSIDNGGSTFVCTTNRQFTLQNPIPGRTVTWSVTNPGLFASATSGTGTIATLRASTASIGGPSVLTFTLTQNGCNPVTVTQNLWIGRPAQPTTSPSGYPTVQISLGSFKSVVLTSAAGATSFTGTWSASGNIAILGTNTGSSKVFEGTNLGIGNFFVTTSNVCGTSVNGGGTMKVVSSCSGCQNKVVNTPNPTNSDFVCEIPKHLIPKEYENDLSNTFNKLEIIDFTGQVQQTEIFVGSSIKVSNNTLNAGLHLTKVQTPYGSFIGKILIVK
jgi:lysyl endopeptidase